LKFYAPASGEIAVNGSNLTGLSARQWRQSCGTVMQDGYIFSDTLAHNIAVDGQKIDDNRLAEAIHTANLNDYLQKAPLGLATKIGNTGAGLSGGQRQRIFIARAVYNNPSYLFFDEATSALDANNERIIMENLNRFFQGRTVVVMKLSITPRSRNLKKRTYQKRRQQSFMTMLSIKSSYGLYTNYLRLTKQMPYQP
jgi:ATP-binding cassette subfamily B protein